MNIRCAFSFCLVMLTALITIGCGAAKPDTPATPRGAVAATPVAAPANAPGMHAPVDSSAPAAPGLAHSQSGSVPPTTLHVDATAHVGGDTAAPVPVNPVTISDAFQMPMSVPVMFEVTAVAMRDTVHLRSEEASDAAGFACTPTGERSAQTMQVLRFAHFGQADSPFAMHWVLYLPKEQGTLTAVPATGAQRGGYEVTLRGNLKFDLILRGATEPLKLLTHKMPEFTGYSRTWPPKGVVLTLANGPIPFFRDINTATQLAPMLTVLETRFTLGKRSTAYMSQPPRVVQAEIVDAAGKTWRQGKVSGVRLTWASSASAVKPVQVSGYNVYRMVGSGTWERVAALAPSETSYIDHGYDGRSAVRYTVTHRAEYPTKYEYEGVFGAPVIVSAVQ